MDKTSKLQAEILKLPSVESAEVYAKDAEVCKGLGVDAAYDVLVKLDNGHLVEGRLLGSVDLEKLVCYIDCVAALGDSNFRNYKD